LHELLRGTTRLPIVEGAASSAAAQRLFAVLHTFRANDRFPPANWLRRWLWVVRRP
jgi:hypothetical protein